jgi:hypothetical protein
MLIGLGTAMAVGTAVSVDVPAGIEEYVRVFVDVSATVLEIGVLTAEFAPQAERIKTSRIHEIKVFFISHSLESGKQKEAVYYRLIFVSYPFIILLSLCSFIFPSPGCNPDSAWNSRPCQAISQSPVLFVPIGLGL